MAPNLLILLHAVQRLCNLIDIFLTTIVLIRTKCAFIVWPPYLLLTVLIAANLGSYVTTRLLWLERI